MLFEIYYIPKRSFYSVLPGLFRPAWLTRDALSSFILAISVVSSITTQFSRSFILAVTRLWNDLLNHVVESVKLQKLFYISS